MTTHDGRKLSPQAQQELRRRVVHAILEQGMAQTEAGRIKMLLGNDTVRQEMGRKANDWAVREFSIEQLVRKTETVYLEALARKRSKCRQEPLPVGDIN